MIQKGDMLRSEEYATELSNILRKDGYRTNMYENVDGYLKDKDRQTIYMHQFLCMEIILINTTDLLWLICW